MFKRLNLRALRSEDMALTLILWLCSLPLVGFVVVSFFGLKVAVVVAVVLFFAAMAICWGLCGWRLVKD